MSSHIQVCPALFHNNWTVIVRVGGFHLLMSYLASIGQIMIGSGLSELWETVYAKGSVIHMLSGHAFSSIMILLDSLCLKTCVVTSDCNYIEISIVVNKLCKTTQIIKWFTTRYQRMFKPLYLFVVISKAHAAQDIYQFT